MGERGIKGETDRVFHWNSVCKGASEQRKHKLGTHGLTGSAASLLARSRPAGEHHCQTLQRKNPHLHHPPDEKKQSTAEISATHRTGCATLPDTQRKVPSREGRTCKEKQSQELRRCCGGQERTPAEQAEGSDRSAVPAPGHTHDNTAQFM